MSVDHSLLKTYSSHLNYEEGFSLTQLRPRTAGKLSGRVQGLQPQPPGVESLSRPSIIVIVRGAHISQARDTLCGDGRCYTLSGENETTAFSKLRYCC